ncbi:MAG TPA: thioesterase, partial [Roseburia sp.]|nr:thioesterase [Roseburia sp.]
TCTAKVVKLGRNITVVAFEITDANGMLLNTGDFTFYNLKEKEIL